MAEKPGKLQKKEARNGSAWGGAERPGAADQVGTAEDDPGGEEEASLVM